MRNTLKINFILILIISLLSGIIAVPASAASTGTPTLTLTVNSVWGSYTYLTLNWTGADNNGYYYKVERSINGINYYEISEFLNSANQSSFSDTLLDSSPNTTYNYRLAIYDSTYALTGYTSNIVMLKLSQIAEPISLKATQISSTEIAVSWSYSGSGSAYRTVLERKASNETTWTTIRILDSGTLQHLDQGLNANLEYTYRVRAILNETGAYSRYIQTDSLDTFIKAPYNLTANTVSDGMIILSWSYDLSDSVAFIIERKTSGSDYIQIAQTGVNQSTFIDNSVSANSRYTYRIKAIKDGASSAYSAEVTAYAMELAPSTNLTATAVSNTEILLEWTDTSTVKSDFEIWRKIGEVGDWYKYAVVDPDTTSFTDTGLDANNDYYYRLRAHLSSPDLKNDLYSAYSNDAKAKTLIPSPSVTLNYSVNNPESIKLLWTYSYNWDESLKISVEKRSESDIDWEVLSTFTNSGITDYVDSNVESYTAYYYRLKLVNSANSSSRYSNEILIVPGIPAPPSGLRIEALSPDTARITWTDNSHNEDSFIIERVAQGESYSRIGSTAENVTTFIDKSLQPGNTYNYRVCAVNSTGKSTYTNESSVMGQNLKTFSDLYNHSWAKASIENLTSRGVINGKTDNQFFPDDQITKAEFTSLVIRSFKLSRTPVGYLADVKPSDWFYKDIMTANTLGIISSDNGYFYPNTPITREDMAVIIYKVLKAADKPLPGHDIKVLDAYTDKDLVTPSALTYIAALKGEKIMDGRSSTILAPKDTATRAEASIIIYRIIDR